MDTLESDRVGLSAPLANGRPRDQRENTLESGPHDHIRQRPGEMLEETLRKVTLEGLLSSG